MPHRNAKLLSAVVIGALAGSALTLAPSHPVRADDCLTAPKGAAPAGGHWRYRIERGTKRQCWYVADKTSAPSATATAEPAEVTPPEAVASSRPPSPPKTSSSKPAKPRALADARAELVADPAASDPPLDSVWPAPETPAPSTAPPPAAAAPPSATSASDNGVWPLASRWTDNGSPQGNAAPASPPPATALANNSGLSDAAAAVSTPVSSPLESQWMLLVGLGAALALAGLIVRLVMRFAVSRPIILREEGLHTRAIFDVDIPDMPAPPWMTRQPASASTPAGALVSPSAEDPAPPPLNWMRLARQRTPVDHTGEAIEELLAKVSPRRPSPSALNQG